MRSEVKRHLQDVLELPNYAPIEAVRYFHISWDRLERWSSGGDKHALVRLASIRPTLLSFKNMVEYYTLEGLREVHHLNMGNIRRAVEFLSVDSAHPLADNDIRTDGTYVWVYKDGVPFNASKGGRAGFDEIVTPYLKRVVRDPYGIARSLFPYMRKEQLSIIAESPNTDMPAIVEIDPRRCFGLPVLVGSRITTPFLAGRHRGGETVEAIARSYGRPVGQIKEAIEWEIGKKAA